MLRGNIPVAKLTGASYFHQADFFAVMRVGHLDICVLGASGTPTAPMAFPSARGSWTVDAACQYRGEPCCR